MLYRLATRGIVFEDFYQPAWGGSTSTGEYSFLTGLAPIDPMVMMASRSANMYFTMGNQLRRLGYSSFAYHDGSRTYYSRDLTLPNMGYDSFVGIGNGMEKGLTGGLFPESDKEMMDYTVPIYIESQPFSVYYMTISGHASYAFKSDINDMSVKNQSVTEGLVFWNDGCWLTEHGYYDTHQRAFTPTEGAEAADEAYITRVSAMVADRLSLSRIIENEDYYGFLFN